MHSCILLAKEREKWHVQCPEVICTSHRNDKDNLSIGAKLLTNNETYQYTNRQSDKHTEPDLQQNKENVCK